MRKTSSPQRSKQLPRVRATPRTHLCVGCNSRISTKTCSSCGTRSKTTRTSIKARCDRMAAAIVKLRAKGKCENCGHERPLDWAHGWPRRHHSLRWVTNAAFGLCRDCHRHYTDRPLSWSLWLNARLGRDLAEAYERLANEPWDRDYGRVLAQLSAALAAARKGSM